jgi:hypothetical protein
MTINITDGKWEGVCIDHIYKFLNSPATNLVVNAMLHKKGKYLYVYHRSRYRKPDEYLIEDLTTVIALELIFK